MPVNNRPARIIPKPGQESVWDYPRPPRVEPTTKPLRVIFNGVVLASSHRAIRILETSHPPIYYIPPADIQMSYLTVTRRQTFCEFKGMAAYYTISVGAKRAENAAWFYPQPSAGYESIRHYVAFYAGQMDACYVNDELVTPQPGDFYGGWVTADIVGPFKGDPQFNTNGW